MLGVGRRNRRNPLLVPVHLTPLRVAKSKRQTATFSSRSRRLITELGYYADGHFQSFLPWNPQIHSNADPEMAIETSVGKEK